MENLKEPYFFGYLPLIFIVNLKIKSINTLEKALFILFSFLRTNDHKSPTYNMGSFLVLYD